ncbi:hypothetical protein N7528_002637 [Penicillium herquei]|nr:hypothetical protein N7528_002637 [Penicillium herquei]
MPRKHKVDPDDVRIDSYICDTDGYAVQAGCYYYIQLPDGRNLSMMPPEDLNFGDPGKLAFGDYQPAYFYLTWDVPSPWRDDSVKFFIQRKPNDPKKQSLFLYPDPCWTTWRGASPVCARRTPDRTVIWIPDDDGTLKVDDTPIFDSFGDKYYALMSNETQRLSEEWWVPIPEDLEVKFVYVQDI